MERKWLVLLSIGLGTFMSALDGSVVNAIIPVIRNDLATDFGTTQWIMMIYLVTVSGLLLTFGRLGDLLGHKRVYLAGFWIFVLGSALCGFSRTVEALIISRAFQAIGAAMLFSNSPALLIHAFPPSERGRALGIQGSITYLGLVTGPALGGLLAQKFGWPSAFFVNVPIGLLALVLANRVIERTPAVPTRERFDLAGAALFLVGLSALLLALSHGTNWGWTAPRVVTLLSFGTASLAAFIFHERRTTTPMLDLSLFRIRVFSTSVVSALLNYICLYAVTFLVPFYLIQFRGIAPSHAGILLSSQAVTMAIVAPLSGTLSDRIGSRLLASLGMMIVGLGLLALATLGPESSSISVSLRLMFIGLGTGIFISPNNSALMGAAPVRRRGVASAVLAGARNVGMVFGVAIAGALFSALSQTDGFLGAFRTTFVIVALFSLAGAATALARGKSV